MALKGDIQRTQGMLTTFGPIARWDSTTSISLAPRHTFWQCARESQCPTKKTDSYGDLTANRANNSNLFSGGLSHGDDELQPAIIRKVGSGGAVAWTDCGA